MLAFSGGYRNVFFHYFDAWFTRDETVPTQALALVTAHSHRTRPWNDGFLSLLSGLAAKGIFANAPGDSSD